MKSYLDAPLRFHPIFRRYLWGGRRLATHLHKPIGPETDYAESWEIVDHGADQSVVVAGHYAGRTLHELATQDGSELFGRHWPQSQFPLLFKFLDCARDLSLQVHPNDDQAAQLDPPDLGKTEAWVILDAEPGSVVYAGLKRGFDRAAVEREIASGTLALCLNKIEAKPGDCLFIPAGTVHALGKGLLVAEIQQASDTTFRLFDWNRVGPDGKPRPLHVEQGLAVTNFNAGPVVPQKGQQCSLHAPRGERMEGAHHAERGGYIERLVGCEQFLLDRLQLKAPQSLPDDARFHLLAVLEGAVMVQDDPTGQPLSKGQTALIPAACRRRELRPLEPATLLDVYLP